MSMILAHHDSPVGQLTLSAQAGGLTGVYFPAHGKGGPPPGRLGASDALDEARRQLDAYFARKRRHFDLKLAPHGTPFQMRVWAHLLKIPYGETVSYGWIAAQMEKPNAARAVGAAVGSNPLSIIVPCHRVIGAAGALTGFAGGLERKEFLLALESGAQRLV